MRSMPEEGEKGEVCCGVGKPEQFDTTFY